MSGVLLEVRDLRTTLFLRQGSVEVVRGVSFTIEAGETVGLVGESGCGKSMTALSIMRLVPSPPGRITGGSIRFEGQDLLALPEADLRRIRGDRISMIFQEPLTSLDPVFTIGHQIVEAVRAHRRLDEAAARRIAIEMLEAMHIPSPAERMRAYPHQLSGGMRQRVMIAMALALNPALLIADEPTTALDVTVQAQILDLIRQEQRRRNMAVLLISHNLAAVAEVADRVAVMYAGEIVEMGRADEIFTNPRHPYTQGLLRSLPSWDLEHDYLYVIPGRVPSLRRPPPGCLFAPRCEYALERCRQQHPELEETDGAHLLRCYNPQPFNRG